MHNKYLPTQYHIEIYEDSFANEPSYFVESLTPLLTISVGDYFDEKNYDFWISRPEPNKEKFVVKAIQHVLFSIKDSHNTHKLMVLLKKEPYQL